MFRLSLHIGPVHIDVGVGTDLPETIEHSAPLINTTPVFSSCPGVFESMAVYDEEGE